MNISALKFTGLVILAFPAMASLSHAQENAMIEQSAGDDNVAVITQQNAPQAYASIAQDGQSNAGTILQVGPAEEMINATITQSGSSQMANIAQSGVEVLATGDVIQFGTGNNANAVQENVSNISFSIDQGGEANVTNIYQSRMQGNAEVTQRGFGNDARVDQIEGPFIANATIYQNGSENVVEVLQEGDIQGAVISSQIGSDNYTSVYQKISGPPPGIFASLLVEGDGNVVLVDQNSAADGHLSHSSSGDFNRFEYIQGGDGLHITLSSQASNNNSDYIRQRGAGVQINADRTGTHNSEIWIDQSGMSGDIEVEQTNSELVRAEFHQQNLGHYATIRQINVYDSLGFVEQLEGASTATIEQSDTSSSSAIVHQGLGGVDLIATIYQSGGTDISTAEIQQSNYQSTALIAQAGVTDVYALIVQTGTLGYAEIRQTAENGGMHNSATINQAGEGYSASIHQSGMNDTAVISQI